jgi:DNA-binding FadR family transcriptional regulator
MFKQAKQGRVFDDVINQIQEAILSGKLKPGDRLPAERTLKETFGIGRGTLREALRVLEQKGLIEIKRGVDGGGIVKNADPLQFGEALDLLIRTRRIPLEDLAEFRADVEGIVSGLAARHATVADIRGLREILEVVRELAGQGTEKWDELIDQDNRFHMRLSRIAGNQIYQLILKTVHDNIGRYYDSFLAHDGAIMKATHDDLLKITDAIQKGDSDLARTLAADHVRHFNDYMQSTRNGKRSAA